MLMNIECSIVQSLKVSLTFDNGKTKEREIATGDLCYFEFNKNGKRKTIEGKVTKIGLSNTVDSKSWFIIVDGSLDFSGQMERFCPNQILDVDIIQKHDTVDYVATPNDSTRITNIRLFDGCLQLSTDGGYSWVIPKNIRPPFVEDEEGYSESPQCDHCKKHKKKKKAIIIEDDDEEEDDSSDEEVHDDVIEDEVY